MKTVKDLIAKLEQMPPDAKIVLYNRNEECGELFAGDGVVKLLSEENKPYFQGDDPWFNHDIPNEEKLVFIMSY